MRSIWRNLSLLTCDDGHRVFVDGAIVTTDGTITWVGAARDLPAGIAADRTIELAGRWLTPGLIDCHTHIVFGGQRAAEFARRTAGTSYADIAREGGGILNTVRATRAADVDELVRRSEPRLRALLQEGVTTVEIKSGYGLDFESERRMLLAARALEQRLPVTVVTSLLAAHATPPEFKGRADGYIDLIAQDWLPRFAQERALVDMVDAYCESIAFSATQCDRLFAAKAHGWPLRLHAEQIGNIGGDRMAARHGALACDHLEYATEDDAIELARAGTVAVLLPVAYYVLADPRLPPIDLFRAPRAHGGRERRESRFGTRRVAADRNEHGTPAVRLDERRGARRRHAQCRTRARLGDRLGRIAPGFQADFAAWSIDTPDELGYWIGFNPCSMVVRGGEIVLERDA